MSKQYKGLTTEEINRNKAIHGDNVIIQPEGETFWQKFIGNFNDPIIKILLVALGLNVVFMLMGKAEWYESVGIALAVFLATFISTYSEHSNEKGFKKTQEDANRITVKAYRNGGVEEVLIDDLTYGDYVILQSGDKVPADGIIIDGTIKVDNSALNGESEEVKKTATSEDFEMGDKIEFTDEHKMYRGQVVCSGEAIMLIKTVGMKSVYGEMAKEMQAEEIDSPLTVKLSALAEGIGTFGKIGAGVIAIAYMVSKIFIEGNPGTYFTDWTMVANDLVSAVILAVIIVVMAVPEGLPLMVAMVLAQNMKKMLKDNILVRKQLGIETAGSLNILFSDKTGTITKGQLEVVTFSNGNLDTFSKYSEIPANLRTLVNTAISKNTGAMFSEEGKVVGGNATDRAVLSFVDRKEIKEDVEVIEIESFSSDKKYSATQIAGSMNVTLYKGAVERVSAKCTQYYDTNGNKREFTKADSDKLNAKVDELANKAIRVIALAVREGELTEGQLPDELVLVGILGIRDDVRPDAIEAIKQVTNAGIQVVMITGDRKETAVAIAKDAGLLTSEDQIVLTSDELQTLSDDELKKMLPKIRVIARALPLDKSRMVGLSQELGLVVGMTGDGVNDSPALKRADVGFAMGSGTEVAKEAGDIIILDDNFKSIAKAVLYGRTIYNNIRKFLKFQLTINVSAVAVSFLSPFLGIDHPLSITQILWVNLVMDTLAALAFGGEPALARYMQEAPKKRDEVIVSKEMWSSILTNGVVITLISLGFLKLDFFKNMFRADAQNEYLLTGYFSFFIMVAVFNGLNVRTTKLNVFEHIKENPGFLRIMGLITVVQIVMTFVGGEILRCKPLSVKEWLFVLALSVLIIPIDMIRKAVTKK
jgi:plasma-membrane calcium-translocating P-type ATPase